MHPAAQPSAPPAETGVRTSLKALIDLRHRVREVPLFSTPHRRSPLVGLHHSKLRGRGVDFDQVRVYQAGDDVRTIDWRVTARTQEPHTKLFHEERERPIYLLVEQSRRLFFGSARVFKSVLAAEAASLIGWAALLHNDRVGGLVFGNAEHHEIKPRRNKQSLLQLLDRLARANGRLDSDTPIEADAFGLALRRAREVLRPGSLAVILCDERTLTDTAEQQLSLLARTSICCCCRSSIRSTTPSPRPACCASPSAARGWSWTPTTPRCARPTASWARRAALAGSAWPTACAYR